MIDRLPAERGSPSAVLNSVGGRAHFPRTITNFNMDEINAEKEAGSK